MTQIPATTVSGTFVPSSTPPDEFGEEWFDGTNFHYATPSDYFDAPISWPRSAIAEVWTGSVTVDEDFFGIHVNDVYDFQAGVPMEAGIIRLHDGTWNAGAGLSIGRTRWNLINQSNGVYQWEALDWLVEYWYARGKKMVYTFAATPNWASARPLEAGTAYGIGTAAEPSSMTYLSNFATALATRYDGRITLYEIWNEPDLTGFYTGTAAKLAEMGRTIHTAVKAVNAANLVIAPSVTGGAYTYLDGYLTASDGDGGTGADWLDIIGCHFYGTPTTDRLGINTPSLITNIQNVLTTRGVTAPIWNTECGGGPTDWNSLPSDKMKYIFRSMILCAAYGVESWHMYSYDSSLQGISGESEYAKQWNDWRDVMLSGAITRVNRLWDGRLACVIGGEGYIV